MTLLSRSTAGVLIAAFALSACSAGSATYPSLGARPIEKLGFAEPEPPAPEPVKADPALDTRVAGFAAQLRTITDGFAAGSAKAEARARAASGKPVGSDAWLDAQAALATLDDWRAQASAVLTDIEIAGSDRAAALLPPYPALAAIAERAQAEAARESATIVRLQDSLPAA